MYAFIFIKIYPQTMHELQIIMNIFLPWFKKI